MKKYYIAYGSNLNKKAMRVRCRDAKVAYVSKLDGWKLVFKYYLTIERCEGCSVPVVLWEVSPRDEFALDVYEGFPSLYRKENVTVNVTDKDGTEKQITAFVYIMRDNEKIELPSSSYMRICEEGYEDFGLDFSYLEEALKRCEEEIGIG